ncbi:MAG TPA: WD40 repeat domain-containing protein [Gemmataceae bacterium]|nr:WD40 repeat domain-containing protein [Gemmataceae bacterium]
MRFAQVWAGAWVLMLAPLSAQQVEMSLTLQFKGRRPMEIAFSPDGKSLCAVSSIAETWDVATGRAITIGQAGKTVFSQAIRPDLQTIAWGAGDGTIQLWDLANRKEKGMLKGHQGKAVALAFSRDGKMLASAGEDQTVKIWDVESGKSTTTVPGQLHKRVSLALSPDGKILAAVGIGENTIRLWNLATGKVDTIPQQAGRFGFRCLAFSHDGTMLASGELGGRQILAVTVWDVATCKPKATLLGHTQQICCVAFSPDGTTVASGSTDQTVRLWSLGTGIEAMLPAHRGEVRAMAFSPDGKLLASGGFDGTVKIWKLPDPKKMGP